MIRVFRVGCVAVCLVLMRQAIASEAVLSDARLDRKVTVETGLTTLDQFAAEMTRLTGVRIEAGSRKDDWRVKERKTIVFAKDIPAKDLLLQAARLHHYTLSAYDQGGTKYYRYWQDQRSRQEEADLQEFGEAGLMQQCSQAVQKLAGLSGVPDSTSQPADPKDQYSFRRFLTNDPVGKAMCDVAASLPPEVWHNRGKWTLSSKALSEQLKEAAERLFSKKTGEQVYISFEPAKQMGDRQSFRMVGLLGQLTVRKGDRVSIPLLKSLDSPYGEFVVKMVKAEREGMPPEGVGISFSPPVEEDNLKDEPALDTIVKPREMPDYPELLKAVHEGTGLSIISDTYHEPRDVLRVTDKNGIPARGLFNALRQVYAKQISKEGALILISDKAWYDMRAAEIPAAYLEPLRRKITEEGLGFSDIAGIAAKLTDPQITKTLLADKHFNALEMPLSNESNREAMRFFTSLNRQQIETMKTEPGLAIESLADDVLDHALQSIGKTADEVRDMGMTICGYKEDLSEKGELTGMAVVLRTPHMDGTASYQRIGVWSPPIEPARPAK